MALELSAPLGSTSMGVSSGRELREAELGARKCDVCLFDWTDDSVHVAISDGELSDLGDVHRSRTLFWWERLNGKLKGILRQ